MAGAAYWDQGGPIFAHTTDDAETSHWQLLATHLDDVAIRAGSFSERFDARALGEAAGRLHDVGKASAEFQAYLRAEGPSVDHSTVGAQIAVKEWGDRLGRILAFGLAGHHAGLADGRGGIRLSPLSDRLRKPVLPIGDWKRLTALPTWQPPDLKVHSDERRGFQLAFFIRMLFSCLVDADRLETERFDLESRGAVPDRGRGPSVAELRARLERPLADLARAAVDTPIKRARARILDAARDRASAEPGLFSLTVPTGGGKTLASLAFALDHAVQHGLERVVFVIPFTSIVEQTADVFRRVLGDDAVLEHHSAFDIDTAASGETDDERPSGAERWRLAAENWDAPVVVTTAVQFFESLFSNRPSRCRKLHRLARAVAVLDEAQTLPLPLLRPCVAAIDELARNYRSSVVLCTATQPALERSRGLADGLEGVRELAPAGLDRDPVFRRVRFEDAGTLDDGELAARLSDAPQVLCIVNTRAHARELYEAIKGEVGAYHLSTLMCAAHRRAVLAEIRARLAAGKPVRLVSTSLIEAGVDISFPLVLRAEAGLDQILQAAGRCNREGELDGLGATVVFTAAEREPPAEIAQLAAAGRDVRRQFAADELATTRAIQRYFQHAYFLKGEAALDRHGVLHKFGERAATLDFPFETVADAFRMIETAMVPVIIRYDARASDALQRLRFVERAGGVARALQPFTVQVPPRARARLLASRAASVVREADFGDQFVVLENDDLYRTEVGLDWDEPTAMAASSLII